MRITFVSKDQISLAVSADPLFRVPSGSLHFDISGQPVRVSGPDSDGKFTIILTGLPTTAPLPATVPIDDPVVVSEVEYVTETILEIQCPLCHGNGSNSMSGELCWRCSGVGYTKFLDAAPTTTEADDIV
jgi:hypothetical protein